nr:adhesion G-protein coupled receptor G7 [Danio rerio]|eukprot:XP_021325139.1 adhesion G-protein coupled receptor G7 [Danio rerio]
MNNESTTTYSTALAITTVNPSATATTTNMIIDLTTVRTTASSSPVNSPITNTTVNAETTDTTVTTAMASTTTTSLTMTSATLSVTTTSTTALSTPVNLAPTSTIASSTPVNSPITNTTVNAEPTDTTVTTAMASTTTTSLTMTSASLSVATTSTTALSTPVNLAPTSTMASSTTAHSAMNSTTASTTTPTAQTSTTTTSITMTSATLSVATTSTTTLSTPVNLATTSTMASSTTAFTAMTSTTTTSITMTSATLSVATTSTTALITPVNLATNSTMASSATAPTAMTSTTASTTTTTAMTSATLSVATTSTTTLSTPVNLATTSTMASSTTATTAMTSTTASTTNTTTTSATTTTAMTSTTATSTTTTTAMTSTTATSTTTTTAMTSTTASTTTTTAMTSTTASTTTTTAMTSTTATSTTTTTAMTSSTATSTTTTTAMTSTTASTTVTTAMTSTTVTTAMTSITTTSTTATSTTVNVATTSTTSFSTTVNAAVTSTTFSAAAATSPNLVCENSGTFQKGICLCPDGWTGTTCNIPNFCPGQTFPTPNAFTFPKTVLGQFASSVEQCPSNTPNAGIPQASALCNIITRTFEPPNQVKCNLTLDSINADVPGANLNDKKVLASSTQILTSIPERLTSQNITNAVKITHFLLSNQQTTDQNDIVVSAVATVSQLLSTREEIFSSVSRSAVSLLTQTLQKISLSENSSPLLVQPNIAMQSLKGQTAIRHVQLTYFKGISTLKDLLRGMSVITFCSFVDFNKDIGFVLYDNDRFFQSNSFQPTLDTKRRVISASLPEITELDQIKFTFTESADSTMSLNDFACVFWSYSKNDWSPDGCFKTTGPSGQAECRCLPKTVKTNFAILMSFNINYQYSEALSWISIIGCALSVVGLSVTSVYQIITRKSRGTNPTLLVVNVCISMMVFYLLFIFGINNPVKHLTVAKSTQNIVPASDYHTYPDQGPCTVFTALLQFFLLATFTWNTLYGFNVFLLFKNQVSGTPTWFPKVALPVGWGLPAVIVGISLGSTYSVKEPLGYRQEEFCWLAALDHNLNFSMGKPMFWGLVLPLLLMLISNAAILLHFSHNICKTNPNLGRSRKTPLKNKILSSFSLAVMLGLSWSIGYILLIVRDSYLQFLLTVVFCVLNTTQGVQILILFTLRPVLKAHPAILAALRPSAISLHRRTFYLWKNKTPDSHESYISTVQSSV